MENDSALHALPDAAMQLPVWALLRWLGKIGAARLAKVCQLRDEGALFQLCCVLLRVWPYLTAMACNDGEGGEDGGERGGGGAFRSDSEDGPLTGGPPRGGAASPPDSRVEAASSPKKKGWSSCFGGSSASGKQEAAPVVSGTSASGGGAKSSSQGAGGGSGGSGGPLALPGAPRTSGLRSSSKSNKPPTSTSSHRESSRAKRSSEVRCPTSTLSYEAVLDILDDSVAHLSPAKLDRLARLTLHAFFGLHTPLELALTLLSSYPDVLRRGSPHSLLRVGGAVAPPPSTSTGSFHLDVSLTGHPCLAYSLWLRRFIPRLARQELPDSFYDAVSLYLHLTQYVHSQRADGMIIVEGRLGGGVGGAHFGEGAGDHLRPPDAAKSPGGGSSSIDLLEGTAAAPVPRDDGDSSGRLVGGALPATPLLRLAVDLLANESSELAQLLPRRFSLLSKRRISALLERVKQLRIFDHDIEDRLARALLPESVSNIVELRVIQALLKAKLVAIRSDHFKHCVTT